MTDDPRRLAVRALMETERGGYSNLVAGEILRGHALSAKNRALFLTLFYGTLERLLTLHRVIDRFSALAAGKMKPEIRAILSVSAFQILFLNRVPPAAAVNEGVRLAKSGKTPALGGFVNAVLRRISDGRAELLADLEKTDDLSYKYACNPALADALCAEYGRAGAERFLAASMGKAPVYVRANPLRADGFAEPDRFEPTDLAECLILRDASGFSESPDYLAGRYHVQDKSSQAACAALGAAPGERILDVCAAPGGKTCTLAEDMRNTGEVIACDLYPARVDLLQRAAGRLGLQNITAVVADATAAHPDLGFFDRVLCDVPCSGYGVIRRKPELKWKDPASFSGLPEVQYQILAGAASHVKPGGRLLYSTCTVLDRENGAVTERFLRAHPRFRAAGARRMMPDGGTDGFYYRLFTG